MRLLPKVIIFAPKFKKPSFLFLDMEVLIYNELDYSKVKKQFEKTINYLKAGDFKSADVKKMVNTGFYRAKLDDTNRLLFKYTLIDGKKYLLLLEVILNHAYEKSRFLNGSTVDESKLSSVQLPEQLLAEEITTVNYVNAGKKTFHILDKILSFDEIQEEIFSLPSPLIIIGSAGSGKTALTLEKIKTLQGRILYTTLSAYLTENSQNLYYSFGYDNEHQEVEFMSFQEYMSAIEIPQGREIDFRAFEQWIWRFKQSHKVKDAYKVYEEFKGVLTGAVVDKPYLSEAEYLNLGVKQSIFLESERAGIYDLFTRYLTFLDEGIYFDSNILAQQYLGKVQKNYDFVVIDEVQDITNVQLYLIVKSLHHTTNFILCGDANQIVHPNFFSWTNIKSLFYKQELKGNIIRILATNYRNTPEVTKIANQLLLVKNARFGSIDKESTYLVKANAKHKGEVQFMENTPKIKQDLNQRTRKSAKFAVIVMRNEDKEEAKRFFQTPLLFSIHEVKGLEYENIILYDIISNYEKEFREIATGVNKEDLEADIHYARAKDKTDKSLDEYKFYINSLYVAITRAIKNLYVIESNKKHPLLALLDLTNFSTQLNLKEQASTAEEWQKEARRLEMQGKKEQADAIRNEVLQIKPVPWEIVTRQNLKEIIKNATDEKNFNKKAKDILYEYALFYNESTYFRKLHKLKYGPAEHGRWQKEGAGFLSRKFFNYKQDDIKPLQALLQKHGTDFRNEYNLTPLMLSVIYGAEKIFKKLLESGASLLLTDNYGNNALRLLLLQSRINPLQKKNLNHIYPLLKNESLKLKIGNRFIKIDSHQAEYLMLNFALASFKLLALHYGDIESKVGKGYSEPYFESADFLDFFEGLPIQVIAEYRTKRSYISSILTKNEVYSDSPYNKKLFLRITKGKYIINPLTELMVDENWVKFYELVDIELIEQQVTEKTEEKFDAEFRKYGKKELNNWETKVQESRLKMVKEIFANFRTMPVSASAEEDK